MRVLGLDLGTNSVGWALIEVPQTDDELGQIIGIGSRVFPAGLEIKAGSQVSRAATRRVARSMRRQVSRRRERKSLLRTELSKIGLLPVDGEQLAELLKIDPNTLWADSSSHPLTLHEIGRLVYHLAARRGFLSLRSGGAEVEAEDEEESSQSQIRLRKVQEAKLQKLWTDQTPYHPDLLSQQLLYGKRGQLTYPVRPVPREDYLASKGSPIDEFGVHGLVFFQRKVYWDQNTIGVCELTGKPRANRADRIAQEFRIWQTVANIRIYGDKRPLTPEESQTLVDKLMRQKSMEMSKVRQILKITDDAFLNFDRHEDSKFAGHETDCELRKKLGGVYDTLTEQQRDELVGILLSTDTTARILTALQSRYGFTEEIALKALTAKFSSARARYSRKAMRLLLPKLKDGSDLYAAIQGSTFESAMPKSDLTTTLDDESDSNSVHVLALPPTATSPLVNRTLHEVRKVVNGVIREYGLPDVIRVEMSRDISMNKRQKEEYEKRGRANEKEREIAKKFLLDYGGNPNSGSDIERVILWREQNERCLYSGRPITPAMVLNNNQTEVDHILPRAQTLNNARSNKALVLTSENQNKGDRTVAEWLELNPEKFEEILLRAKEWKLPRPKQLALKRQRVTLDLEGNAPSALLVQTGHINRLVRSWFTRDLGFEPQVSNGRLTSVLSTMSGLRSIGLDKRTDLAKDFRRHAIDATIIAVTDRRMALRLAAIYARKDHRKESAGGGPSLEPWPYFRYDVKKAFDGIIVSHRVARKRSGQLHKETLYGAVRDQPSLVVVRRKIEDIDSAKRLLEVVDPAVRAALVDHLRGRGIDPESFKTKVFAKESPPTLPSGVPINKVRCHLSEPGARQLSNRRPTVMVLPENNHHGIVSKFADGRFQIDVVKLMDLVEGRLPLIEGVTEQFTLARGDVLRIDDSAGLRFVRVVSLDGSNRRVFITSVQADQVPQREQVQVNATWFKRMNATKVQVDPIGRVRRAKG